MPGGRGIPGGRGSPGGGGIDGGGIVVEFGIWELFFVSDSEILLSILNISTLLFSLKFNSNFSFGCFNNI